MNLTSNNKTEKPTGVVYHKLNSEYDGDKTKNCSLIGKEIDENFYFLRGNDIVKSETIGNITYLIRVNGEKIEVPHTEGGGGIYITGDDIGGGIDEQ